MDVLSLQYDYEIEYVVDQAWKSVVMQAISIDIQVSNIRDNCQYGTLIINNFASTATDVEGNSLEATHEGIIKLYVT